jgi:hypothetical protein
MGVSRLKLTPRAEEVKLFEREEDRPDLAGEAGAWAPPLENTESA